MPTILDSHHYQALIQERADIIAEAKAVLEEDRSLTTEEKERDDAIQARLEVLNDDVARAERQRERERSQAAIRPPDPDPVPVPAGAGHPIYTRPNTPSGGPFAELGEQLQAIQLAATGDIVAKEKLLAVAEFHQQEFRSAAQGAGIAIDSDGGFLVQTDFSTEIMQKMHDVGQLIGRVRRVPLGADANGIKLPMVDEKSRADGSRWGGIRGYWVAEGGAPTASQPTFAQLALELHKVAALGYATEELLSHVTAMTAIFTNGFAEELLFKVEDAIFEGDGAGKPQGFTNSPAIVTVDKETAQGAATVLYDNLKKMWARLDPRSRANAAWYINMDVEPALDDLAKLIGTGGVEPYFVAYSPSGVLTIKGRPVVTTEYASTLGTLDDIVLADLSQYAFIDRGGVQQAQSLHVRFTTDEMAFRATYRCDGGGLWKEALTPFKGTNTTSPFVNLAARA